MVHPSKLTVLVKLRSVNVSTICQLSSVWAPVEAGDFVWVLLEEDGDGQDDVEPVLVEVLQPVMSVADRKEGFIGRIYKRETDDELPLSFYKHHTNLDPGCWVQMLDQKYELFFESSNVVGRCSAFHDEDEFRLCNGRLGSPNMVLYKYAVDGGKVQRTGGPEAKRLLTGLSPKGYSDAWDVQHEGALVITKHVYRSLKLRSKPIVIVRIPDVPRAAFDLLVANMFPSTYETGEISDCASAQHSLLNLAWVRMHAYARRAMSRRAIYADGQQARCLQLPDAAARTKNGRPVIRVIAEGRSAFRKLKKYIFAPGGWHGKAPFKLLHVATADWDMHAFVLTCVADFPFRPLEGGGGEDKLEIVYRLVFELAENYQDGHTLLVSYGLQLMYACMMILCRHAWVQCRQAAG
jgi:hypothetical protein